MTTRVLITVYSDDGSRSFSGEVSAPQHGYGNAQPIAESESDRILRALASAERNLLRLYHIGGA